MSNSNLRELTFIFEILKKTQHKPLAVNGSPQLARAVVSAVR